jgi:hypothetical protein
MAGLGPGARRSGEIADALGVKINSLGGQRQSFLSTGDNYYLPVVQG